MTNTTKTLKSILDYISEAKQERTVVKRLKEKESFELKSILQGNFNSAIHFPFPPGAPPYDPSETEIEITEAKIKQLGQLTMGRKNDMVSKLEKETTFIRLLESVSADDAKIIIAMKDGELEELYPKITKTAAERAFPNVKF